MSYGNRVGTFVHAAGWSSQQQRIGWMTFSERKRVERRDFVIAALVIATGLTVAGVSLLQLTSPSEPQQLAQIRTDQPSQSDDPTAPAESKPGGTRPTTPPPQPARPDTDAQGKGARPALPPAPAEKSAPPIDAK
jgi:hypothetical protein